MKKQLIILSAFFMSMTVFAQNDELKNAEKALKANDFATAVSAVNQAESLIANADQKTKAKFYYLKGLALYQNGNPTADIEKVGAAFNQLINFENEIFFNCFIQNFSKSFGQNKVQFFFKKKLLDFEF